MCNLLLISIFYRICFLFSKRERKNCSYFKNILERFIDSCLHFAQVYRRLVTAVNDIEKRIPFSHHDRLGFLTFCPTNLGTTVRASVHIKVPKLAANKAKLEEVASKFNLQVCYSLRYLTCLQLTGFCKIQSVTVEKDAQNQQNSNILNLDFQTLM